MTATAHHAASQRRASLTMTLFLVGLAVAIALVVFDFASAALPDDLLEPAVLGDCVERVDGAAPAPCQ